MKKWETKKTLQNVLSLNVREKSFFLFYKLYIISSDFYKSIIDVSKIIAVI